MTNGAPPCPVCANPVAAPAPSPTGDRLDIACNNCGHYKLTGTAAAQLEHDLDRPTKATLLAYYIRKATGASSVPTVNGDFLQRVWTEGKLPGPSEAIDNLILWLGNNLEYPGRQADVSYKTFQAIIGAASIEGFAWVIKTAVNAGLIDGTVSAPGEESRLPQGNPERKRLGAV